MTSGVKIRKEIKLFVLLQSLVNSSLCFSENQRVECIASLFEIFTFDIDRILNAILANAQSWINMLKCLVL